MSPARTNSGAPVSLLQRGISVLACFGPETRSLTLTEIAELTKLPLSTTHRVAGELTKGGFLVRGADKSFHIGTRMWSIAQNAPINDQLRQSALPTLARLYEETGENVTLAILDRGRALYVDRIHGSRSVASVTRAGGHLPLHMTGVGKVLLANQSDSAIEKYLAKPLLSATKNTIVDPDILRLALAEVREQGFAVAREEISIGTGSVAVPIFVKGDVLVAALGVVVHVARIDVPALVTMLRSAAETISLEIDPVRSFTKTKPELRQR